MLEPIGIEARLRRMLRGDFIRDGAIVFGSTMLVNVLSYVIHFALSRKFGVPEYGAFVSLLSAMTIFGLPAAIVTTVFVKLVAELHALGDSAKIRVLSARILSGCVAFAVLFVVLAIALRAPVAGYLHLSTTADVVAAAFALGFGLSLPVMRGILQGTQDFVAWSVSAMLETVGRIVLAIALGYAGYGVAGAFAGYALASAISAAYTLAAVRKHWSPEPAALTIDGRRLFATAGGAVIATAAITVMSSIDIPLVKHFFSANDAGVYGAAAVCGKILLFAVSFIPTLVLPKAARHAALGEPGGIVLLQSLGFALALIVCGLGIFALVPQALVRVTYGAAFVGAAGYIFKYGIAMGLLGVTNIVVTYKIALHRYDFVWALLAMTLCELLGIQFFHATLTSVINVLLAVNAAALALCLLSEGRIALSALRAHEAAQLSAEDLKLCG